MKTIVPIPLFSPLNSHSHPDDRGGASAAMRRLGYVPGRSFYHSFVKALASGTFFAIVLAASIQVCAPAESRPQYRVVDLGTLPGGHYSSATRINKRGEIAGIADNGVANVPFLYTPSRRMKELPWPVTVSDPTIWDLNSRGQVLVYAALNATTTINLAGIGPVGFADTTLLVDRYGVADVRWVTGMPFAYGYAMNNLGDIVGADLRGDFHYHPFRFSDGVYVFLDSGLGDRRPWSQAVDVNDSRSVIAWAPATVGTLVPLHTFVLANGTKTDIGTLPGGDWTWGQRINNRGHVLGGAQTATRADHSFLWRDGQMIDLGNSTFCDFNNYDEAVGRSADGQPVIYTGGVEYPLAPLINGIQRYESFQINGINDAGQMVGSATGGGETHAILLVRQKRAIFKTFTKLQR